MTTQKRIEYLVSFLALIFCMVAGDPSVLAEEPENLKEASGSQPVIASTGENSNGSEEYADEETEPPKPAVEGKFEVNHLSQSINTDSRLNPENKVWALETSKRILEISSQISDYLDEDEHFRWLFKGLAYSEYGSSAEEDAEEDLLRIDELLVDWAAGNWFASIGKRRITWGTTSAFNPVNVVVPPKNPLEPDPQTEGHPIILLNYGGEVFNVDVVLSQDFDRNWDGDYKRWGARVSMIFDDIDIGLYYYDGESTDDDEDYSRMIGASYSSNLLTDATLFFELASFSENYRIYFGENRNPELRDESVIRGAVGSVITMDDNASVVVELYHNGSSYTKQERENFYKTVDTYVAGGRKEADLSNYQKWVLFQYQTWQMNRHYFLASYNKSFWEKYKIGFSLIAAEDASTITTTTGTYSISDYYVFEAVLKNFDGDEDSEFGNYYVSSTLTLSLSSSF